MWNVGPTVYSMRRLDGQTVLSGNSGIIFFCLFLTINFIPTIKPGGVDAAQERVIKKRR